MIRKLATLSGQAENAAELGLKVGALEITFLIMLTWSVDSQHLLERSVRPFHQVVSLRHNFECAAKQQAAPSGLGTTSASTMPRPAGCVASQHGVRQMSWSERLQVRAFCLSRAQLPAWGGNTQAGQFSCIRAALVAEPD